MVELLITRYHDQLSGVLSCYDRILITGTIPTVCYAAGMTTFLYMSEIRIFDYARFAEPLRERIREQAQALAKEAGVTIQHVAKANIRKEDLVAGVLKERGEAPGLVHIIFPPWRLVMPMNPGTTSRTTKRMFALRQANACTTTFISWMRNWGSFICGYPLGVRSDFSSIVMATAGLPESSHPKALVTAWRTTPLSVLTTGNRHNNWLTAFLPMNYIVSSTVMPPCAVQCLTSLGSDITGV